MTDGTPFGTYPEGRELIDESDSPYAFLSPNLVAKDQYLAYAREHFEERDPAELDFASSHRKVYDRARGGYFRRYGMADIFAAKDSGVTSFCVIGDQLVLLEEPGRAKIESKVVGIGIAGREVSANAVLGTPGAYLMAKKKAAGL